MTSFSAHTSAAGKRSITAFGDSITAGASVTEGARWANRLAARLHLDLRNKGISGTLLQNSPDANGKPRAGNAMDRFQSDLLGEDRSDCIAILYGFNDARHTGAPHHINLTGFVGDYRTILAHLTSSGFLPTDLYIGSVPHLSDAGFCVGDQQFTGQNSDGFEAYSRAIRDLAHELGTFYAPVNETMKTGGGDALVLPDHVHPNAAGHGVIADAFADATVLT